MVKIGARPEGRLIEQHDVMFIVGMSLLDVKNAINQGWQAVKNCWHIDAWREVNRVGDFYIEVIEKSPPDMLVTTPNASNTTNALQLYFINLGGYLPNEFEEFHHKLLVVADSLAHAKHQARQTAFYRQFDVPKTPENALMPAVSHVDDGFRVDIDEMFAVSSLLDNGYQLRITPVHSVPNLISLPHDSWHIGYLSIKNLPKVNEQYYG